MTMLTEQHAIEHFNDSIATLQQSANVLMPALLSAAEQLAQCLQQGGKILICGNGGSASDAQHFSGELVGRLEVERTGYAAIALTADTAILTAVANDYDFDDIFARQVHALGKPDDVLIAITTSGNSANITKAVQAAHASHMTVVALSGRQGGNLAGLLNADDNEIRVPATRTIRIQETHAVIIHCLCDLIDQILSSEGD